MCASVTLRLDILSTHKREAYIQERSSTIVQVERQLLMLLLPFRCWMLLLVSLRCTCVSRRLSSLAHSSFPHLLLSHLPLSLLPIFPCPLFIICIVYMAACCLGGCETCGPSAHTQTLLLIVGQRSVQPQEYVGACLSLW